jgi:hypothetical protein
VTAFVLVVEDTGIDVVVVASGRGVADSSAEHAGMASAISATRALVVPTFMARPGPESSVVEQIVSAWVLSASSYEINGAMENVAATWESQRQEPIREPLSLWRVDVDDHGVEPVHPPPR